MDDFGSGLLSMLGLFGSVFLGGWIARNWIRTQGKHSVFQNDDDLEAIGLSVLMSMDHQPDRADEGFAGTFRPTLGAKLTVPIVGGIMLAFLVIVLGPNLPTFGGLGPMLHFVIFVLPALGLIHATVWIGFFHKVNIQNGEISVVDEFYRTRTARLSDLKQMERLNERRLMQLSFFGHHKGMSFSVHLQGYNRLVHHLQQQISANVAAEFRSRDAGKGGTSVPNVKRRPPQAPPAPAT